MNKPFVLLALVAGCGAAGERNASAPAPAAGNAAAPLAAAAPPAPPAESDSLVGLWQAGQAPRPDQLCVVRRGDTAQFGLVVWGANLRSCSGAGTLVRAGDRVTLTMTGDSACAIDARIEGGRIVLADRVPQGCAYYCGAGAKLEGAALSRAGTGPADAAKAKDLAGDPLCG
jgi:hypothetical protein